MPIVITGAVWRLYDGESITDSGDCIVNGSEFMALLEPKERGSFVLEVEYTIAPELRKVRIAIDVT